MNLTERLLIRMFNTFIKRTVVMATLEELQTDAALHKAQAEELAVELAAIKTAVGTVNVGLDAVAVMIAGLKAGQVSQAQLDALSETFAQVRVLNQANVAASKEISTEATSVVAETEALKA